ncbi:unnamed protein product [Trichobilharzia regenti]|nr:unnamed protein product [Trichobilharzia regenti]
MVKIDTSLQISPWVAMPTSYQLNNSKAWLPVNLFDFNDQRQLIFYASDPRGIPGWSGRILSKSDANGMYAVCMYVCVYIWLSFSDIN